MFNHLPEQFVSQHLDSKYNCSFLWHNHTADQNQNRIAVFAFNEEDGGCEVHVSRGGAHHGEVFFSYGQMNNLHLLTKYGFAVPLNRFDAVKVQLDVGSAIAGGSISASPGSSLVCTPAMMSFQRQHLLIFYLFFIFYLFLDYSVVSPLVCLCSAGTTMGEGYSARTTISSTSKCSPQCCCQQPSRWR